MGRVKFAKVDVDRSPQTAANHSIRGVPAIFFYKNGSIVDRAVGALPRSEIERRVNSLL